MTKKRYWTKEETKKLLDMRKEGHSYFIISMKIRRTISACQTQVHNCKMGVDRISNLKDSKVYIITPKKVIENVKSNLEKSEKEIINLIIKKKELDEEINHKLYHIQNLKDLLSHSKIDLVKK